MGQGGVEGECLFSPRLSASGRALARYASASGFCKNTQISLYEPGVLLDGRKASFSGFGATVALRAYIGY
jgi:hypothetical protein